MKKLMLFLVIGVCGTNSMYTMMRGAWIRNEQLLDLKKVDSNECYFNNNWRLEREQEQSAVIDEQAQQEYSAFDSRSQQKEQKKKKKNITFTSEEEAAFEEYEKEAVKSRGLKDALLGNKQVRNVQAEQQFRQAQYNLQERKNCKTKEYSAAADIALRHAGMSTHLPKNSAALIGHINKIQRAINLKSQGKSVGDSRLERYHDYAAQADKQAREEAFDFIMANCFE